MSNSKENMDNKNAAAKNNLSELQEQNDALQTLNAELYQSEKKFKRLIDNLETEYFFYSQNLDGKYNYVSPSITKLLGYNSDEVEYGILQFLTDHPKNKLAIDVCSETKKGIKQAPFEIEIKDKNNNLKYFELLEIPIFNKKNEVKIIEGLAHDITERIRAEQVQKILGNISNAVLMSDSLEKLVITIREQLSSIIDTQNFYIALYNKETDSLSLPFIADEKDDIESFPAEKTMTGFVVKTKKSLMVTSKEQERMVKNGDIDFVGSRSEIWLGVPLKIKNEVIGVLAVQSYTDVNAYNKKDKEILEIISNQISQAITRKNLEVQEKEQQELFNSITSSSNDAIIVINNEGNIIFWNNSAERIFGYTSDEIINKDLHSLIRPEQYKEAQEKAFNIFRNTGKGHAIGETVELTALRKNGEEFPIALSLSSVKIKGAWHSIGTVREITERKRVELIQKVLYEIALAVNTTENVADFVKFIQTQLGRLFDTTNFYVAFYDANSGMLSTAYIEDEKDDLDTWPAEKSLTGHVIKHTQTLHINKAEILKMYGDGIIDLIGTTAEIWVGVPLLIKGEVKGALVIQDYNNENAYSKKDVEFLEFISNQVSTAIERKKAAEELKTANIDLQEQKEELQQQNEENEQQNEEIRAINDEMQVMNQDLLVSEAKVRRLIENLEDEYIFYSQNIDGHYEYMSPSAQRLLGYSAKELEFGLVTFLTENELNKVAKANFQKTIKGEKIPAFQIEITDKYEQSRFFEILIGPIYNKNNKITHIEGIAHEITERKKAELIQSIIGNISNAVILSDDLRGLISMIKDQLERLLDTRNFYVALFNAETNIVSFPFFINDKDVVSSRTLGISLTDYVITHGKSLIADIPTVKKLTDKGVLKIEGALPEVWVGVPLKMHGEVIGVVSVQSYEDENAYDATDVKVLEMISTQISLSIERKRVADELRTSNLNLNTQKEELETTLESLQDTQSQLIQSEKMAALGQLIAGIAHEINTPLGAINASVGNMSDALDTAIGNLPTLLSTMNKKDLFFYLKLMSMIEVEAHELSSKEKRQLKKEVIKRLEENNINEADKIGEMLIYMKVNKHLDQLMPMLRSDHALYVLSNARNIISLRKNTQNINLAVSKASKVVFALKKFAHRDHIDEKTETDLIDGIETVLTLYHNQIKQGVEVFRNFKTIPTIKGHPDELNQVWTNLFHNSLQAMNNQGNLTVSVEQEGDGVSIKVSDTGSGIPEELREKVFLAFFTTKIAGEGSGLGLDIVKKIIDKHGGKIDFESEVGVGTTFMIWLPLGNN